MSTAKNIEKKESNLNKMRDKKQPMPEKRPEITGTLKRLDRRVGLYLRLNKNIAFFIAIMLRHPRENYIHRDKEAAERKEEALKKGLRRHEDKNYFKIIAPNINTYKDAAYVFVDVHNDITDEERDTVGDRDVNLFDGKKITIYADKYAVVDHGHLKKHPEIVANLDGYKIEGS